MKKLTTTAALIAATLANPVAAQDIYVAPLAIEKAPEYFADVIPMAEECMHPDTTDNRIVELFSMLEEAHKNASQRLSELGYIVVENSYGVMKACRQAATDIQLKRQQDETFAAQQAYELKVAAENAAKERVTAEAVEACFMLDAKDPIAARTNRFCHEVFLKTKYRD